MTTSLRVEASESEEASASALPPDVAAPPPVPAAAPLFPSVCRERKENLSSIGVIF